MTKEQEKYAAMDHIHLHTLVALGGLVLALAVPGFVSCAWSLTGHKTVNEKQQARIESLEATVTAMQFVDGQGGSTIELESAHAGESTGRR